MNHSDASDCEWVRAAVCLAAGSFLCIEARMTVTRSAPPPAHRLADFGEFFFRGGRVDDVLLCFDEHWGNRTHNEGLGTYLRGPSGCNGASLTVKRSSPSSAHQLTGSCRGEPSPPALSSSASAPALARRAPWSGAVGQRHLATRAAGWRCRCSRGAGGRSWKKKELLFSKRLYI